MKRLLLALLLGPLAWTAPPLLVTAVERKGLPPYEDGERAYRLEGTGCQTLQVGEVLVLHRRDDARSPGRLQVLSVHQGHALARLVEPGATFPLKGDLAVRTELLDGLPAIPAATRPAPLPGPASFAPATVQRTFPHPAHREPIYFLKQNASLSPAGAAKLQDWVQAWGLQGRWFLDCPQEPGEPPAVLQERVAVLRQALRELGAEPVQVRLLPPRPTDLYDAVFVVLEGW